MAEEIKKQGFGFTDDANESLRSKGDGGKFGLNQGVNLTKFEYNPNAGRDGAEADAIDITVQIGEREHMMRLYDITKIYDKDSNEITDQTSEEYIKKYNDQQTHLSATIIHILKVFRSEEDIRTAMQAGLTSFADWAKVCQGLLPAGFQNTSVDVFLEYQWKIKGDADKTYLQLPRNMKGGYWICPAVPGNFKEDRTDGGLKYLNEAGQEHPFTRNEYYMESPKANQQVEGGDDSAITGGTGAASNSVPQKSTW